jgi:hypothetical protein
VHDVVNLPGKIHLGMCQEVEMVLWMGRKTILPFLNTLK